MTIWVGKRRVLSLSPSADKTWKMLEHFQSTAQVPLSKGPGPLMPTQGPMMNWQLIQVRTCLHPCGHPPRKRRKIIKKMKMRENAVKETDLKLMNPERGDFFCPWQLTNHYQSFPFSPAHFSFSVEWWEKAGPTATQCHCFVLQQREAARYSSAAALLIG